MNKLLSVLAVAALAGCSDSSNGTGKLTVQMTDAPFPYAEVASVNVFVVRVDARNATATDAEATASSSMSGWTTIAAPNKVIDLLTLRGGVTTNLGTATLSSGTYNGFRLVIDPDQSNVILKNGATVNTTFPSGANSGIKINLDHAIEVTQDSSVMILDFDVGKSFVMRGNSIAANGLAFKPVIRAVATELTGSVSGTVRANSATGTPVANATVEILKAGTLITSTDTANVVRTTSTDANGAFTVKYLLPGTYVVRATPAAGAGLSAALLSGGLTITAGATVTNQVIVVLP
jgi:hypothetical protein